MMLSQMSFLPRRSRHHHQMSIVFMVVVISLITLISPIEGWIRQAASGRSMVMINIEPSTRSAKAVRLKRDGFSRKDFAVSLVSSSLLIGGGGGRPRGASAADEGGKASSGRLLDRIDAAELKSPGLAGFGSPTVVFLPSWLLGTWNCSMSFVGSTLPLGEAYVPQQILRSVKAVDNGGAPVSFLLRFFSTLPDTAQNTLRVTLGEMPKSEVVPDRAYNTRSVLDAYYGYPAVSEIAYDMVKTPLRMKIDFSTIGPDLQPLSPRRQELFFNNLQFSEPIPGTYVSSEFVRTATLGRGISVTDSETLSKYVLQPDGSTVEGVQRVALYLTPNPNSQEGALYFETGGRAVAEFMYKFVMRKEGDCVTTPKGVEQCVGGKGPVYRVGDDDEEEEEIELDE